MQNRSGPSSWGFTVVELLVVIGIVLILAALAFPVFVQAKREGIRTKAGMHLRGTAQSIALYREESGGASTWGEPDDMGLPPTLSDLNLPDGYFRVCPPATTLSDVDDVFRSMWLHSAIDTRTPKWAQYAQEKLDGAIAVITGCPIDRTLVSPFHTRTYQGVALDTHVERRKMSPASPTDLVHWR